MKRMTLYWTLPNTDWIHRLQECLGVPRCLSLNGEQYVEVDDEKVKLIEKYQADGCLQIRHKQLEYDRNGELRPVGEERFHNIPKNIHL